MLVTIKATNARINYLKFNIIINLGKKETYWEPNKLFSGSFKINGSGFKVEYNKEYTKVIIKSVVENSDAQKSGLKVGDELLEINGIGVKELSIDEIFNIQRQVKGKLNIKVLQDNVVNELIIPCFALIIH